MMRIRSVGLLLAVALVTGCPKAWMLTLYNNTAEDLVLALPSGDVAWDAGSAVEIVGTAATSRTGLHWISNEEGHEIPVLRVKRGGSVLSYRGVNYLGLPDDLVDYEGPTIRQWLQLEPDGSLYAIKPDSSLPVHPLPSQPGHFPIQALQQ